VATIYVSYRSTEQPFVSAVPDGALLCTSVPGYQLDLGAAAPDVLRRALGSAACVVGILTPNSLETEWVLFELGAARASDGMALAGGLEDNKKTFDVDAPRQESRATFAARRARIGNSQGRLLDYVTAKIGARPFIPIDELTRQFARMDTPLYCRLEQLRLLGFLRRIDTGESGGEPVFGWTLSDRYRREVGV
jgi:hypothetical protein